MLMEGACATLGCWRRPVHEFVACLLSSVLCIVLYAQAACSRCAYIVQRAKTVDTRRQGQTQSALGAPLYILYPQTTKISLIGAPAHRGPRAAHIVIVFIDLGDRPSPHGARGPRGPAPVAYTLFPSFVFDLGQRLVALRRRAPPHQHLSTTTPIRATPHCHTDSRHSQTPTELRQSSEHTQL